MIAKETIRVDMIRLYSEQNIIDLNNIHSRFSTNLKGFFKVHHYYITLLIIAAIVDGASTIYFMHLVGPEKEIHPIIREMSFFFGPTKGPIFGKIFQFSIGMLAAIYLRKYAKHIFVITAIMYSWAATANFLSYLDF